MEFSVLGPTAWAEQQYGPARLGDRRRTARAVEVAAGLMRNPAASLPVQMGTARGLKAAYRLFAEEEAAYPALLAPHWKQTRQAAGEEHLVLLVQDTTQLDYTHHPTTEGLGPIGDGGGQGILLHTTLAIVPEPRRVLGIAAQEPFLRQAAPEGEVRKARRQRPRESQVWVRAVQTIGPPPPSRVWVHVTDAYADSFEFMDACRQAQCHFLLRVAQQERRVGDEEGRHLGELVRSWSPMGEGTVELPARQKRPARQAQVHLSFGPVELAPPLQSSFHEPLAVWAIRVWETDPPPEVEEPVEWLLLTSVPTTTAVQAWERTQWYRCRWLAEDYHQCLKSGCQVEKRQLQEGERLIRLLGFLAPVAVRLLQLRELARLHPEILASAVLPKDLVQVVALLAELPPDTLTMARFWRAVAGLGGYLGRKRDGPPGWKTLWKGWLHVQTILEGVHLASRLPP